MTLRIEGGSTVAIVGRTGAGKSTFIELLTRLRDPTKGEIRVGGRPLPEIPLSRLRGGIGLVPQEPFLFSRSVRDNVRLGILARGARSEECEGLGEMGLDEAVRIASLDEAIETFEEGLDTLVGERGITLSGGQKQRVTIARALLLNPDILVLDDALSSVDTETERRILEDLAEVLEERTTIIVTHRFNALELVDTIFVLEEGRLLETGSYDELMARRGFFAEMVERQQLEEELS